MRLGATMTNENGSKPARKTANNKIDIKIDYEEVKEILFIEFYTINDGKSFKLYIDNHFIKEVEIQHNDTWCTRYNAQVLPDENDNCSLCGEKLIHGI